MPRTINIEQHAVFVTLADHSKHRVSEWLDWPEAIDLWTAMDDQRREALAAKGLIAYNGQPIKHYEVRSENDPAYAPLPRVNFPWGFAVYTRQYTTVAAAARAVLQPLGYYSKAGGWVYYRDKRGHERVLIQGWWQAAQVTGHGTSQLKGEKGHRGTVTTALQVKVEKVEA